MRVLWECPKCEAANGPAIRACEQCGADRPGVVREAPPSPNTCARCGDTSPSTTAFHDDGDPEDKGVRLCPSCWVPALVRRSQRDPMRSEDRTAWRALVFGGTLPVPRRVAL